MAKLKTKPQPVESSALKQLGYNKDQKIMEAQFSSDQWYRYSDITQKDYDRIINAPSVGVEFYKTIKGKSYIKL